MNEQPISADLNQPIKDQNTYISIWSRFWLLFSRSVWPSAPTSQPKWKYQDGEEHQHKNSRSWKKKCVSPTNDGDAPDLALPVPQVLKSNPIAADEDDDDDNPASSQPIGPSHLRIRTSRRVSRSSSTLSSERSPNSSRVSADSSKGLLETATPNQRRSMLNLSRSFNNLAHYLTKRSRVDLSESDSSHEKLRIHIGTWNMNGRLPLGHLHDFIPSTHDRSRMHHILIIGSQECQHSIEKSLVFPSKEEWESTLKSAVGEHYVCVCTQTLAAIHVATFVLKPYVHCIKGVESGYLATGFAKVVGNKGATAIGLHFDSLSLLFICSHFAAHQHGVNERNNNFQRINEELRLSGLATGKKSNKSPTERYDCTFWFGDLNYRVDVDRDIADEKIHKHNFSALLLHDQLLRERGHGRVFSGYTEPDIEFPPTYKFDVANKSSKPTSPSSPIAWMNPFSPKQSPASPAPISPVSHLPRLFSSGFSLASHRIRVYDTSSKMRVPAWTDRILYKTKGPAIQCLNILIAQYADLRRKQETQHTHTETQPAPDKLRGSRLKSTINAITRFVSMGRCKSDAEVKDDSLPRYSECGTPPPDYVYREPPTYREAARGIRRSTRPAIEFRLPVLYVHRVYA
ncbi:hypothetical protein SmJEL517_g05125 [Synchytrium microbalum]|uniref:Inositol polyphosphate-related phosphatase domain-containing protein n=1 Tax=Synchytrium microbalum TaxID=1806994 RepID=A0A507C0U7_9FUNG|nr:uncharacterized protein SmJEL517_g05125 [Synchytrium microbalum]TPX31596.1 hypothetical protein SmJEL517_g05125 [Synchytrium microbalum]